MTKTASPAKAYLAAILIGLLPAWMILLPLDMTSDPDGWQIFLRVNSFAVPLAQLIFIFLAMGLTFSPFRSIGQLSRITKSALSLWLLVAALVSYQAGNDHLPASIGLFKLAVTGLFFLALINLRRNFGSRFLLILWASLGVGAVSYVILWTIHIFLVSPQDSDWVYRIPGVNNVRHTGHFALAGLLAGLFCFISFRQSPNIWLRWVLPLLFSTAGIGLILWTGSRGPLLASAVTMFVTFCVAARVRKPIAGFCIATALAATTVVAVLPLPHEIYGIAGATGMADVSAQGEHDASSGRKELWTGTMEKITERPLFGWGINQFGKFGPSSTSMPLHPHNFPLQFLFSGGIVSVVLTILIIFPALRNKKWPYTKGPGAASVAGVIGLLVYSLYDGVLYFSYPTMLFLVAVASAIAPAPTQRAPDKSG
ncbi:O-antigen ligase family protein [Sphingorhabdus sp.]|uniref:O-antigen ligase family protein n=1 Tax=Sphingorhabdus sp. TaxID=1902408 RepID=UPI00391DEAE5